MEGAVWPCTSTLVSPRVTPRERVSREGPCGRSVYQTEPPCAHDGADAIKDFKRCNLMDKSISESIHDDYQTADRLLRQQQARALFTLPRSLRYTFQTRLGCRASLTFRTTCTPARRSGKGRSRSGTRRSPILLARSMWSRQVTLLCAWHEENVKRSLPSLQRSDGTTALIASKALRAGEMLLVSAPLATCGATAGEGSPTELAAAIQSSCSAAPALALVLRELLAGETDLAALTIQAAHTALLRDCRAATGDPAGARPPAVTAEEAGAAAGRFGRRGATGQGHLLGVYPLLAHLQESCLPNAVLVPSRWSVARVSPTHLSTAGGANTNPCCAPAAAVLRSFGPAVLCARARRSRSAGPTHSVPIQSFITSGPPGVCPGTSRSSRSGTNGPRFAKSRRQAPCCALCGRGAAAAPAAARGVRCRRRR